MNINIVAGKCSEQNNKYIFSLLKNRDKNKKHIIIAPDRSLFSLELRLFSELNESSIFDIRIVSFSKLSKEILSKVNTKKILTKQSGVAIVKKLLTENQDKLFSFGKATNFIGFASALYETICLLKSCNIPPEEVYIDDTDSYFNLKQKDIKLIYNLYEEYLSKDYTDSFNQLKLFADLIEKDTYKDTIFYLVEFDDFTSLMYSIISKLSRFSDGINICCNFNKGKNKNIYSNKVYYDLISLYKSRGFHYNIITPENFGNYKDFMVDNLLSYEVEKKEKAPNEITINNFDNVKDEVKYIFAEIYSSLIRQDVNLSKFCLVTPNINDYKSYIIKEAKNYNINYYFDENEILSNHILIRTIFGFFNIISSNFILSDFLSLLKNKILNYDELEISKIDKYLKSIDALPYRCLTIESDNEDIQNFINLLNTTKEKIEKCKCLDIFENIVNPIVAYVEDRSESFVSKLDSLESRIYTQVRNKLNTITQDFLSVFASVELTFDEFVSVYMSYFESTNISLPPITSNTLFIADINSSYISNFEYVYILGCNEGIMPKLKIDNGLITDEEINRLPNASKINPTIATINNRKIFKLFDTMFRSCGKTTISYLSSLGGGQVFPNNLIISLLKLYEIKINKQSQNLSCMSNYINKVDYDKIVFNNLTPQIAKYNLIKDLKNWQVGNKYDSYVSIMSTLSSVVEKEIVDLVNIQQSENKLPRLKNINLFKNGKTSVSQIQSFYMCPYRHFVSYGLKLNEEETSRVLPNDIGNIIHMVLSLVVPYILENNSFDSVYDFATKKMDYILENQYRHLNENKRNTFIIKSLYEELKRIIKALINEINCSSYKPKYYEIKFNDKPFYINNIQVIGTIDRVDVLNDKFIVIDYKTGDNSFSNYNDVYIGKKLQLLIYGKVFEEQSNLKCGGVFYFPLVNDILEKNEDFSYRLNGVMLKEESNIIAMDKYLVNDGYSSTVLNLKKNKSNEIYSNNFYKYMCLERDDFNYLFDFAVSQVSKAIENILDGEINPSPIIDGQMSTCSYCKYKTLCNYTGNFDRNIEKIESIQVLKDKTLKGE